MTTPEPFTTTCTRCIKIARTVRNLLHEVDELDDARDTEIPLHGHVGSLRQSLKHADAYATDIAIRLLEKAVNVIDGDNQENAA